MGRLWLLAAMGAGLFAPDAAVADDAPVRAWQDSIRLVTYRIGEASPSPQFSIFAPEVANYPYPLLKNLTKDRQDHVWRTLNLENEFLLCRILPDLGGHLYSCRDKRNGREIFYANPVIKPGDVGLRGAWAALGIESNFPVGHTRVSTSPVDFAVQGEPDGSGRAIVEDIDRVTGMQWRVEYILRPGATLLEQRVTLYNRSAVRWPYYWWANAGIAFDDPGMRMILPAHMVSTHATPPEILAWPARVEGKDASLVANNKNAGSWFAYGSREPFFAVYKPSFRGGLAHYADPGKVSGKKLWIWGADQDAWVKRELTDNFPSYVELQGGVFQNQDVFEFLRPEQSVRFSEFWIPVYDLGGVTRVTRDAILNLQRRTDPKGPSILIELGVTTAIRNAVIRVLNGGKTVFEARADLSPGAPYSKVLDQPLDSPYTIQLADSKGAVLLEHIEGRYDTDAVDPAKLGATPKPYPDGETEEALLARGDFNELQQHWPFAWADYSKGLQKFPSNPAFARTAGNVALNLNRFEEAAELLSRAVSADPSDAASTYGLGLAQAMLGKDAQARRTLSKVPARGPFGPPAALQLALLSARGNDDAGALAILKRVADQSPGPVKTGGLEVALLRRSGRKQEAQQRLNQLYIADPADNTPRVERVLLGARDDDLWKHLAANSGRVLDLVDQYLSLGSYRDALGLLTHAYPPLSAEEIDPGDVPVALDPMIVYYRAFCRAHLGEEKEAVADWHAAAAGFTRYVFPNRWSSFAVLKSAVKANPSDVLSRLLLGRLFLSTLNVDEAIAQWQEARKLAPGFPELNRDLGSALIEVKKDAVAGMTVLKAGLKFDPRDPELRELATRAGVSLEPIVDIPPVRPDPAPRVAAAASPAESSKGALPRSNVTAAAPGPKVTSPASPPPDATAAPRSASPLDIASAALLKSAAGKAGEADGMFDPKIFSAEKQPDQVRQAWIEVQLQKLISMAHAGKCVEAMDGLFRLGNENPALSFTLYGFDKFTKLAHFQYYAATINSTCHQSKAAGKRWTSVSKMHETLPSLEFAFPILAAWKLDPDSAKSKAASGLDLVHAALAKADAQSKPRLTYIEGMLFLAAGEEEKALQRLQDVLKSTDEVWLKYLSLLELQRLFADAPK